MKEFQPKAGWLREDGERARKAVDTMNSQHARVMKRMWKVLKVLPSDYADYGGEVVRWADRDTAYPDCSGGCRHFLPLEGALGSDWGVCVNAKSPRSGLLTWEHQAGHQCYAPPLPDKD